MIVRHQVFEVTIELGDGTFTWNRLIMGKPTCEKVLQLLDEEIDASRAHPLNELGDPSLVDLHKRYHQLVTDFGMPEGAQRECRAYGMIVGMIYTVAYPQEMVQIGEVE